MSGSPPNLGCRVTRTSVQTIATGAFDDLEWNGEDYDQGGWHSTSLNTERIAVPAAAVGRKLLVTACVRFDGVNTTGVREVEIRHYDSGDNLLATPAKAYVRAAATTGPDVAICAAAMVVMSEGDYLIVAAFHNATVDCDINGGSTGHVNCSVQVLD